MVLSLFVLNIPSNQWQKKISWSIHASTFSVERFSSQILSYLTLRSKGQFFHFSLVQSTDPMQQLKPNLPYFFDSVQLSRTWSFVQVRFSVCIQKYRKYVQIVFLPVLNSRRCRRMISLFPVDLGKLKLWLLILSPLVQFHQKVCSRRLVHIWLGNYVVLQRAPVKL